MTAARSAHRSEVIRALLDEVGTGDGFIERLRAYLRADESGMHQDPRVVGVELPADRCFAMFDPDANNYVSVGCSDCSEAEHRQILEVVQEFAARARVDVEPYYFDDTGSSLIALHTRPGATSATDEVDEQ